MDNYSTFILVPFPYILELTKKEIAFAVHIVNKSNYLKNHCNEPHTPSLHYKAGKFGKS